MKEIKKIKNIKRKYKEVKSQGSQGNLYEETQSGTGKRWRIFCRF